MYVCVSVCVCACECVRVCAPTVKVVRVTRLWADVLVYCSSLESVMSLSYVSCIPCSSCALVLDITAQY